MQKATLVLLILVALTGCMGMEQTSEHFDSDIPGFTEMMAPRVLARGQSTCADNAGITATVRNQTTEVRLQNLGVEFKCE